MPRPALLLAACAAGHALSQCASRVAGSHLCLVRTRRVAQVHLSDGGPDSAPPWKANASRIPAGDQPWLKTKSGLRYVDEVVGSGELAAAPQVLIVRCQGSLLSDGRPVNFNGREQPLKVCAGAASGSVK
jgi:hypothetical protein